MNLTEVLKNEEVTLKSGDYLVSSTVEAGYVPTHRDTSSIHYGKYLFYINGEGGKLTIEPVVTTEDGTEFKVDEDNPIIVAKDGTVTYTTGRNHVQDKDVYEGRQLHVLEDVAENEVDRVVLLSFIEFVQSEYSLGVNDFRVAGAEEIIVNEDDSTGGEAPEDGGEVPEDGGEVPEDGGEVPEGEGE